MFKIICTSCGEFIGYSKDDHRQSAVCLNCYYGKETEEIEET